MANELSIPEIKRRIKKCHGNKVKLNEETYTNTNTVCCFIDKDYGEWWAYPRDVIRGHGHKKRACKKASKTYRSPIGVVIQRLKEVHGNTIKIDKKSYNGMGKLARFIDKDYGEWWATPNAVINYKQKHKKRGYQERNENCVPIKLVVERIYKIHGNNVILCEKTYRGATKKAKFIDNEYGEWWTVPNYVMNGSGHPKGKYFKVARSLNNSYVELHWKTGKELVCIGSYEHEVIKLLNENKIDYKWQHRVFTMPDGRTYRPDLYLIGQKNPWIEIKGYFRDDAEEKWQWFHNIKKPNSQLWDRKKLKKIGINIK